MYRYFIGRLLMIIPTLFGVAVLTFILLRLIPGDIVMLRYGTGALVSEDVLRAERARYGLDRPIHEQFVNWLWGLVRGDLGLSMWTGKPVAYEVAIRLELTLELAIMATVIAVALAIPLGTLAAVKQNTWVDYAVRVFSIAGLESMPSFWLGMILIAVFGAHLRWFPIFGARTPGVPLEGTALLVDVARHLALPLVTLILVTAPGTFLVMRYAMLQVLGEPYIATARAKGVGERSVLFRHAMRNALLPVCTVFMLNLGFVASGATVIETVFSYPGVGRLMYEAVLNRDYPVIQAAFFVVTLSVMAANALADLLYPLIDPRVRDGRR